ncbi:transporter protein, putative [Trypanosoma equiperdum]|uniref:Transporter protein, putative n=2 Tax=Trypanozoon TaxID=39700 RepID=Q57YC1_TRYB2|nr:transporter protein, putative [Trypanosoma brucei brucei TREU927]AAX69422.1 transporter protein, putative [Trypanosoma brucei]AAZ12375.1 transporter protein, putative [Trypanosoma brucei brucei TREU927]SCU65163.1 transporter protein, putative [Trypanosoma equiperdum]
MAKRREVADDSDVYVLEFQKNYSDTTRQSLIVSDEVPDSTLLWRNMVMFTLLKIIGSYDSGAFSAAVGAENGIADEWGLTNLEQGALSASVFLGCMVGCPLAGHLFSQYSAKIVLIRVLVLHIFFTFCFATVTVYVISMVSRFLIGVTLSFIFVYVPVWVDDFAPRDRQSVWMALHNAGVPVGVLGGYLCGAILPSYTRISWEWAFYSKCIFTVPVIVYFLRVDHRSVDRNSSRKSNVQGSLGIGHGGNGLPTNGTESAVRRGNENVFDRSSGARNLVSSACDAVLHIWKTAAVLLGNIEYTCSVLAMCSLYFVVSGLQNFMTQYLHAEPFNASMKTIMVGFGTAIVASPIGGVITGGVLLDRLGGYQQNTRRVMIFTTAWGAGAAFFSVLCIFAGSTSALLVLMSLMLFCGGAVVPSGSGRVMASLPDTQRPAGAALAQMVYNLVGNFSGPLVCGSIAQWMGDLKYGIRAVFCCSVIGLVPMVILLFAADRHPSGVCAMSSCGPVSTVVEERLEVKSSGVVVENGNDDTVDAK